ncbi:unnamed protein product [Echinostoma caproni]|uniref:Uncharacterized protein n=1 Tax=Echinostoma caproni TaxID=27848 RepID=A0A3P8HL74_9TREM|nr:unnamed protein product [Echinostoma caproni]
MCWDENALLDNLQCYFDTIEAQKSSRIVGDVIISVSLSCPPTGEQFQLDLTPFFERYKSAHKTKDATDTPPEEQEENIANA